MKVHRKGEWRRKGCLGPVCREDISTLRISAPGRDASTPLWLEWKPAWYWGQVLVVFWVSQSTPSTMLLLFPLLKIYSSPGICLRNILYFPFSLLCSYKLSICFLELSYPTPNQILPLPSYYVLHALKWSSLPLSKSPSSSSFTFFLFFLFFSTSSPPNSSSTFSSSLLFKVYFSKTKTPMSFQSDVSRWVVALQLLQLFPLGGTRCWWVLLVHHPF